MHALRLLRTPGFLRARAWIPGSATTTVDRRRAGITAGQSPGAPAVIALALAVLALSARPVVAQLAIDSHTIDGGGYAFSSGGGLTLGGTVGQPDAGTLTGGAFVLSGGFWLGGSVVSGVPETPGGPATPGTPDVPGSASIPLTFRVLPAWPNPFSASTTLGLDLPEAGPLQVRVFAPSGRLISELCARTVPPGHHRLAWNGADTAGNRVASGVYLLQVQAGTREAHQRIVMIH